MYLRVVGEALELRRWESKNAQRSLVRDGNQRQCQRD